MMARTGKRGMSFRMTLGTTNLMAGLLFVAGIVILVNGSVGPELANASSTNPVRDIVLLLSATAILAVVIAVGSSADRRCADDYAYQLLATGAMVGMFAMIGANALWALDFVRDAVGIRGLRGQDMMAIGMVGWGVAYVTFRIRGLK
jgi:hypothetical protein